MLQTAAYTTVFDVAGAVLVLSILGFFVYTGGFVVRRLVPGDPLQSDNRWVDRLGSLATAFGTLSLVGVGLPVIVLVLGSGILTPLEALGLGVAVGLCTLLYSAVLSPSLIRRRCSVRRPSESERARLRSALEAAGSDLDSVRVLEVPDTEPDQPANYTPIPTGFGPFRRLYVPEPLFGAYEDEPLRALCATSVATSYRRYRSLVRASWLAVVPSLLATLSVEGFWTDSVAVWAAAVAVGVVLALVGSVWGGWRLVYRADRQVARRLGPASLVDGWETAGARRERPAGILRRVCRWTVCMLPPEQRRLDRLRRLRTETSNQ